MEVQIKNRLGEKLNTLIEGKKNADTTVVFAHGFGVHENDKGNLLADISDGLIDKFRIVRFDFSGFGKSDGRQEDVDLEKQAGDLQAVLDWVHLNYPGKINIIAQSMGTMVVSLLSPDGIDKTIYSGVPVADRLAGIKRIKERILSRGEEVNEDGISLYPRTGSGIFKIGPNFWKVLNKFDHLETLEKYIPKTKLTIFKPLQDEVVGNDCCDGYKNMAGLDYIELNGSHGFHDPEDRQVLIKMIKETFDK